MKLFYEMFKIPASNQFRTKDRIEFWLIFNGEGKIVTAGKSYDMKLHDMILIPTESEVAFICSAPVTVGRILADDIHYMSNNKPVFTPGTDTGLIRQLFFIALDISGKNPPYKARLISALDNLVHTSLISAHLVSGHKNPYIVEVINDILNHAFDPDFDLIDRIIRTGYTPNYFRRIFRQETGVPPLEFMNNIRIDHAKELLIQKDDKTSFSEIALACGFSDVYYFSRLFKKNTGYTPKEYVCHYHEWSITSGS